MPTLPPTHGWEQDISESDRPHLALLVRIARHSPGLAPRGLSRAVVALDLRTGSRSAPYPPRAARRRDPSAGQSSQYSSSRNQSSPHTIVIERIVGGSDCIIAQVPKQKDAGTVRNAQI